MQSRPSSPETQYHWVKGNSLNWGKGNKDMKVRAVVFDLDGTILDIAERDAFSRYQALCQLGYNVSLEEVRKKYRYGIGKMGIVRKWGITLTKKETKKYLRARFTSFMERENALRLTKIHQGAYSTLSSLSEEYELILSTSRNKLSLTEEELEWFNIKDIFNLIVTREVAAKYSGVKDIPLIPFQEQRTKLYECVIGLTEVNPKNMVCIGDSSGELEPASRLKMTTVGVLTGMGSREDLEETSEFTIQGVNQVNKILNGLDSIHS